MMICSVNLIKRIVVLFVCLLLVGGCSSRTAFLNSIQSVFRVQSDRSSQIRPDKHALGKQYFLDGRYGLALDMFLAEQARNSRSIPALNGIAACYDQLKRYDLALIYYYKALQLQPDSFETLSNLGYSFILQERTREARSVLQLALYANPQSARIKQQLAFLEEPPEQPLAGGAMVVYPVLPSDKTGPSATGSVDSFARASLPQLKQGQTKPAGMRGKIEVSNGNGSPGNARLLARYLKSHGERVWRITNAKGFNNQQTVIYYRPGSKPEADRIAGDLPATTKLLETSGNYPDIVVRMVIGQDMVRYESMFKRKIGNQQSSGLVAVHDGGQTVTELPLMAQLDSVEFSISHIMRLIRAGYSHHMHEARVKHNV
ncbi:MAG: LytR C-terminal domain-containing protein [Mariprofundus sp.]